MEQKTIARLTGLAYFAMLPGGIAFLVLRARLAAPSADATLELLASEPELARLALAAAMIVIVAQAGASLGFFALHREARPNVAFGIAGFGLINAAAILAGAAASWAALTLASQPAEGAAVGPVVLALGALDAAAWKLGGIFFGLWLIPMGVGAATTELFHAGRVLGGILIVGGVLYVLGAFAALSPALTSMGVPDLLAMPATVGELWMMGALLVVGVRDPGKPGVR